MKFKIGKLFNIPVFLSDNYLIFVAIMIALNFHKAFITTLAIISISISVVLHELGHSLTARYFKVKTESIVLYFFGGIASFNQEGALKLMSSPKNSIFVWLAGPLVNVAIFLILWPFTLIFADNPTALLYISYIRFLNIVVAIFNLLPIFPLDGGVLLFNILRTFMTNVKAIKITSIIGIIGSAGFIVMGLVYMNLTLGFIGVMTMLSSIAAPKSKLYTT